MKLQRKRAFEATKIVAFMNDDLIVTSWNTVETLERAHNACYIVVWDSDGIHVMKNRYDTPKALVVAEFIEQVKSWAN